MESEDRHDKVSVNKINENTEREADKTSDNSKGKLSWLLSAKNKFWHEMTWEEEGKKLVNSAALLSSDWLYLNNTKAIFKNLLLGGKLPMKYRYKYWLNSSGATREKINNKNYYHNIINNYPDYIPSPYKSQIEKDLYRTYPNEEYFKSDENIKKLCNVLLAYSRRNVSIGYCQGFNFIVGRLLILFDNEEDVFWIFTQVLEQILPVEYYTDLIGMMGDCALILHLLRQDHEDLMGHLKKIGYDIYLNNILYKWFDWWFIDSIQMDSFLAIWDSMFIEGNIVLFRAAIGIIQLLKKRILTLTSIEELSLWFDEYIGQINYDIDDKFNFPNSKISNQDSTRHNKLMKLLLSNQSKYKMKEIDVLREKFFATVKETVKRVKNLSLISDINQNFECDLDWPLCVKEVNSLKAPVVWVSKQLTPMNLIDNYYEENWSEKIKILKDKNRKKKEIIWSDIWLTEAEKEKKQFEIFSDLWIERIEHKCGTTKSTRKELWNNRSEINSSIDNCSSGSGTAFDRNTSVLWKSSMIISSYFETNNKRPNDISSMIDKIDKIDIMNKKKNQKVE